MPRAIPPTSPWGPGPLTDRAVRPVFDRLSTTISPICELDAVGPFQLLTAVMLSAHTTDRAVNRATAGLFPIAGTPRAMVALGVEGLIPHLRPVGLYRTKARNLVALCQQLIDRHGGEVPHDREALEALPGVGRKTANVVLNVAFGEPTIAVDTHIHRVANRLGLAVTRTPEQTEQVLLVRVPRAHLPAAHALLLLHGRYTCTARAPRCFRCPVARWCLHADKSPLPAAGRAATDRLPPGPARDAEEHPREIPTAETGTRPT